MYAVAVRLREEGVGDCVIAAALGIDDDQVPALLQIADCKITNLMASDAVASRQPAAAIAHI
jgi:hypothetical protein